RRYALDELVDGDIRINKVSRTVYKNDMQLEMTAKEFDLLVLLIENKGKALTKEYLFNQIWGSDSFSEQQTLTVHIKWLRQKIEDDAKNPKHILTVWGVGYKYESI
ncbi:MAG: response regulator transcription factor, partial [Oscillospiraceae bacterium]|nr:response regulator transcription factor [Oscillospiraceae bacterium]